MNIEVHYAKNTGYNKTNRPSRPEMVEMYVADAIWVLQDKILPKIRVEQTFEEVQGWDYVRINSTYYFVTDVKMLNLNVAEIYLELDALSTIGVANIDIISGWCVRRHVNDDTPFSNVLPENFKPSEQLVEDISFIKPIEPSGNEKTLIATTVELNSDRVNFIAQTFVDSTNGKDVTVPLVEGITEPTVIKFGVPYNGNTTYLTKTLPNTNLYILSDGDTLNEDVVESIKVLRSLGLTDVITGCYDVKGLIYCTYDSKRKVTEIKSEIDKANTNLPYKWSNVKNNKVYSGDYNVYNLYCVSNGNTASYMANEIYNGESEPKIYFAIDPAPNGMVYARPDKYLNLDTTGVNMFIGCVTSPSWQNTPMMFEGRENSLKLQQEHTYKAFEKKWDNSVENYKMIGKTNSLIQDSLSNPLNSFNNLVSGVEAFELRGLDEVKYWRERDYDLATLNAELYIQPPTIMFPRTETLQSYIGNQYCLIRQRLSDADTQRYDKYLTMYGYRVNEPMTNECFTGRKYFNYVGCEDLNISVPDTIPIYIREMAVADLENGVRLWHVKPNKQYFNDNPIV